MTILVIIILLLAYVFSSSFRKIFEWIYYELAAFWVSHRTWFVIIFLALWLIPTISLLIAGSYANAFPSAVVFVLLFPVWIILSVANGLKNLRGLIQNPGTTVVRSSRGFISVFISAVLIIAVVNIAVGLWSPDTKGALNERFADSKTWTANFFKKGSAHSERNAGVRGRVKSATEVYDDFNKPIEELIPAGRIVMVLKNIQSKPATENREALLPVMLPDQHGNFFDGKRVWMPALKIEFISNEEQDKDLLAKDSAASATPKEKWKIREEKLDGGGFYDWVDATIEKDGDQVIIKTIFNGRRIIFEGREECGTLNGFWKQKDPPYKEGKFLLKISLFGMEGYHTGPRGEKEKYPLQLKRI
jgi:hypothetical protein